MTLVKELCVSDAIESSETSHAASHSQLSPLLRDRALASYGRSKLEGRAIKKSKQKIKRRAARLPPGQLRSRIF